MKVIAYRVEKEPEIIELNNELIALQMFVGGYIETIALEHPDFKDVYLLVCNEEGKAKHLPVNRPIYNNDGEIIDIICGDFFICREGDKDFIGIEDGDMEAIEYTEFIGEAICK